VIDVRPLTTQLLEARPELEAPGARLGVDLDRRVSSRESVSWSSRNSHPGHNQRQVLGLMRGTLRVLQEKADHFLRGIGAFWIGE
jgi:hypothetical protein